jgi:hypothetical protein
VIWRSDDREIGEPTAKPKTKTFNAEEKEEAEELEERQEAKTTRIGQQRQDLLPQSTQRTLRKLGYPKTNSKTFSHVRLRSHGEPGQAVQAAGTKGHKGNREQVRGYSRDKATAKANPFNLPTTDGHRGNTKEQGSPRLPSLVTALWGNPILPAFIQEGCQVR